MKDSQKKLVIVIMMFLLVNFLKNGSQGNWSLILLFQDTWAYVLGAVISYCVIVYLRQSMKK